MNVRDLMKALHTAEQLKRMRGGTQLESVSNGLLDQLPSPFREAVIQHNESDICFGH